MSNSATPKLREFARRLLAYEAALGKPADAKDSAAFRVCEKLRVPLSKVMGVNGFRTLLFRALVMAKVEVPWLGELQLNGNGTFERMEETATKLAPRDIAAGEVVLVAELLGLLVTFLGPALTRGMLQDIWPRMNGLNF